MRKILFSVILLVFLVLPLFAEDGDNRIEAGDIGFNFNMAVPFFGEGLTAAEGEAVNMMGIGAVYHPLSFLSVEPGFLFIKSDMERDVSEGTDYGQKTEESWMGGSIAVFYYGDLGSGLYFYSGPRFTYYKNVYEQTYKTGNSDRFTETVQTVLSGVAGLKYLLTNNLAFFGDISGGLISNKYKSKTVDTSGTVTSKYEDKTDEWRLVKGTVGVTFYLW